MIRIVTLNTNRSEYDIRDAAACSMTVRELIDELECNYNEDDKIVFSNDNGYTYGGIRWELMEMEDDDDEQDD